MNDITIDINKDETEAQRLGRMIKYLRLSTGMKREDFANYFHIPLGTVCLNCSMTNNFCAY